MRLKIQEINNILIKEAQNFFPISFCEKLKKEKFGTYNESLVSRYLIEKNKNTFSSISHKNNLVFIGTSENKIGVDIEIFKKRDENLLKENNLDNWFDFYVLWTAKESIIKFENLALDNMKQIILIKSENINKKLSGINFEKKLIFSFKNKEFLVYFGKNDDLFYSVCI